MLKSGQIKIPLIRITLDPQLWCRGSKHTLDPQIEVCTGSTLVFLKACFLYRYRLC